MSETYRVLAQLNPSASTLTPLYTVQSNTTAVVSSILICNTSSVGTTFRISIQVSAEADDKKQYLYYDLPLLGNDTFISTIGVTLKAGDVVSVYAGSANVSFSIFGVEIQ